MNKLPNGHEPICRIDDLEINEMSNNLVYSLWQVGVYRPNAHHNIAHRKKQISAYLQHMYLMLLYVY